MTHLDSFYRHYKNNRSMIKVSVLHGYRFSTVQKTCVMARISSVKNYI